MAYLLYPWLPSSFSLTRTHQLSVNVVKSRSGIEMRRTLQSRPLIKYTLQYNTLLEEERVRLIAFYYKHSAQLEPFWFHDWSESVLRGQYVGVTNGTDTDYALLRSYGDTSAPFFYTEPVQNILPVLPLIGYGENGYGGGGYGGTGWLDTDLTGYEPKAYLDGEEASVRWELSNNQVIIRFPSPPAAGAVITADFAQCRLVRFDSELTHELFTVRVNRGSITIQEVMQ